MALTYGLPGKGTIIDGTDLGLATLDLFTSELSAGVMETFPNGGNRIKEYAFRFGLTPPLNWCAVSVSTFILDAAELTGLPCPINGSAAAQGVMAQFMRAGLWTNAARARNNVNAGRVIAPGNIIVWRRPPVDWMGHIGLIKEVDGDWLQVLEGNSGKAQPAHKDAWRRKGGDRIALRKRSLKDSLILGFGQLRSEASNIELGAPDTLTEYELMLAYAHSSLTSEPICEEDPLAAVGEMASVPLPP